jgi:hypothetical protein
MSKADKMFEKMGYERKESNNFITYIKYIGNGSSGYTISFALEYKTVTADTFDEDYEINVALQMKPKELQAINLKCKELGWKE